VHVTHERCDHVVAELQFVGLALHLEADALRRGDDEQATVVGSAIRSFLRDHIGTWIDAWAARVGEIDDLAPWAPFAAVAALLVRGEASIRHVVPARSEPVLVADAGLPPDDEPLLDCD
jgi:hypothetical protein